MIDDESRFVQRLECRRLLSGYPVQLAGLGLQDVSTLLTLPDNSVVVAGLFSGTVDFQPGRSQTLLTARGDTDVYVARYSVNGRLIWARQIGGDYRFDRITRFDRRDVPYNPNRLGEFVSSIGTQPGGAGEYVFDMTTTPQGDLLLVGSFLGTVDFDPGPGRLEITSRGGTDFYDAYLLKLTAGGDLVFARTFGGRFSDAALAVRTDPQGDIYLAGYYTRQVDIDPGPGVFELFSEGRDDAYVMRLDPLGNLKWVRVLGGDESRSDRRDSANALVLDDAGNVHIAGTVAGDVRLAKGPDAPRFPVAGDTDAFIAGYSPEGRLLYYRTTGGVQRDGNTHLAIVNDALYVGGYFQDTSSVDPARPQDRPVRATGNDLTSTSPRRTDLLISRYDLAGNLRWASQLRATGHEVIGQMLADENGVRVFGAFYGTADFDPGPGQIVEQSVRAGRFRGDPNDTRRTDSFDAFVWQLSANGRYIAHDVKGGAGDDWHTAAAVAPNGRTYVGGRVVGRVTGSTLLPARAASLNEEDALIDILQG